MTNHDYPGHVKRVLWKIVSGMADEAWRFAKRPGVDFTRERKLGFEKLMRFLISMGANTNRLELLRYFGFCKDTASGSAFTQQREKLLPGALRHAMLMFDSSFPCKLYRGKYRLVPVDGTSLNIARNPSDESTFHPPSGQSAKGFNSLHAVAAYDIINKRYIDCVVQPGMQKNEFRAICDLADRYPSGETGGMPVFIADRGMPSYNFFAHANEKGIFYAIRAKDVTAKRYTGLGKMAGAFDLDVNLVIFRGRAKSKGERADGGCRYKYVDRDTAFDYIEPGAGGEYPLSFRVARFEIDGGGFENIVTNLPRDEFPPDVLREIYNMRWGVEISFRDLKHTIGLGNFHSKKVDYIEQEIFARLILYNFCSVITAHAVDARAAAMRSVVKQKETRYEYQVNFSMAVKICHEFIGSRERGPPTDAENLIGSHILPIRPGRTYDRQQRYQRPASFCYRFS